MLNLPFSDETHTMLALPPGASTGQSEPELPESLQLLALVGTDDDPYKEGGPWAYADQDNMLARCFFVTQNTHHNGVEIFSLEQAQRACDKKGMTEWAYIKHDRDTYTEEEIAGRNAPVDAQVGDPKADHIHGVVKRRSAATVGAIARAFGVPPQQVEKKSATAYLDLVEYLTHEHPDQQERGKCLYERDEVVTNVPDLWERLDKHKENRKKSRVTKNDLYAAVSNGEMTPDDVRRDFHYIYVQPNVVTHLKKMRADYLRHRPLPSRVVSVYISGEGGSGKDLVALAIANTLDMQAFKTKSEGVVFEGYDGQRCVIWGDTRPSSLIHALGHVGAVYNAFSPYPQKEDRVEVNIKYASAPLAPALNIVTSENESDEFLSALAGDYEDRSGRKHKAEGKEQAYRRFPLVIDVEKGRYTVRMNKGYFDGTRDYFEYITLGTFAQDLEGLLRRAKNIADPDQRAATIRRVEAQTVAPVVEIIKRILDGDPNAPSEDADAVLADFAHVGAQVAAQTARINPPSMDASVTVDAKKGGYFSPTDFLCTAIRAGTATAFRTGTAVQPRAWLLDGREAGQHYRVLQVLNRDGTRTNYLASLTYTILGDTVRRRGTIDASPASVSTAVANDVLAAGEPASADNMCITSSGRIYTWKRAGQDGNNRPGLEVRVSANSRDIFRVISVDHDHVPAVSYLQCQRYRAELVDGSAQVILTRNVFTLDEAVEVINRGTWATGVVTDDELQHILAAINSGGAA